MELFLLLLVVSAAVVVIARECARWKLFGTRPALGDPELTQLFNVDPSRIGEVVRVLKEIANCYSVPYNKLRPNDRLGHELASWDSWALGRGGELLQAFLCKESVESVLTSEVTLCEVVAMVLRKNAMAP